MNYFRFTILFSLSIILTACATVRDHRNLSHREDTNITASVGSTLFRLSRVSDLPNVVGGRDIYGGKVDRGFAEVKLVGIEDNRFIKLLVFDVNRESSETTMDRYGQRGLVDINQNVNIGGGDGSAGIPVTIDTKKEREYTLSGVRVEIVEVRGSSIVYRVDDTHN